MFKDFFEILDLGKISYEELGFLSLFRLLAPMRYYGSFPVGSLAPMRDEGFFPFLGASAFAAFPFPF